MKICLKNGFVLMHNVRRENTTAFDPAGRLLPPGEETEMRDPASVSPDYEQVSGVLVCSLSLSLYRTRERC